MLATRKHGTPDMHGGLVDSREFDGGGYGRAVRDVGPSWEGSSS